MKHRTEFFRSGSDGLRRIWRWLVVRSPRWSARRQRQLRLCENLALGERRFLSIVECGQQKFLVGGGAHAVAMLAELSEPSSSASKKNSEDVPTYKLVNGAYQRCALPLRSDKIRGSSPWV
ncbi:MAG: flagellar biosynthetic protein FliO [Terriglobales bacterium]